jgi:chemotaxis protein MotA
MENRHKIGINVFEQQAVLLPLWVYFGTVMGLVHVLGNLTDPETLSASIASAFTATLLRCLPS